MTLRKNKITIRLDQLKSNLTAIKSVLCQGTLLMAVVKADAYGHGMVEAARAFLSAGADQLAVATPDEGVVLRKSGITGPILVLGAARESAVQACIENELAQTVMDVDMVRKIAAAGKPASIHIKVDTGMRRIGVCDQAIFDEMLNAVENAPNVTLAGVFTHFADADGEDEAFTRKQLALFLKMTEKAGKGVLRHAANSAATLRFPQSHLDMVRPGIALYGCPPVKTHLDLRPALCWQTEVVHLKRVKKGETIGYGRTYKAEGDILVATLPVGYGDGYHRAQSGRGQVLIGGEKAPVIGRVCMDQTMVDVTNVKGVRVGSAVVLIGRQGELEMTPDDVAKACGTISYEVLLAPTNRVEKEYIGG